MGIRGRGGGGFTPLAAWRTKPRAAIIFPREDTVMRVGIFGGTFDPVHFAHLVTAEQCREQAQLDQVWFVPAAWPPHKPQPGISSFERRADLLRLAVAGHPPF